MPPFKQPTGPIKFDPKKIHLVDLTSDIIDAARAYLEASVAITPGSLALKAMEQKDAFARVAVNAPEGGGYSAILKKVNGIWVVIAAGQDKPGKDAGAKYGMPAGWYSEEY